MLNKVNWNLEDIMPLKDFDKNLTLIEKEILTFNDSLNSLAPEMQETTFKSILKSYEGLTDKLMRLYARAMLWEEVAQNESEPKFLKGKVNNLLIKFDDETRLLWHWIKGKVIPGKTVLDDGNATRLFKAYPQISYLLERERLLAKHTLDNDIESVLTNKDVLGIGTLLNLRALLDTGNKYHLTINGKKKVINNSSELMQLVQAKNPETREKAYRALYRHYQKNETKYFAIYEAIVKNWNYEVKLRNYASAINMRNEKNDISDEVISSLLEVCKKNAAIFQRFFKLKAKSLKVNKLKRFDLYAPYPTTKNLKNYTYDESTKMVSDVLKRFDGDFLRNMQAIINDKHIDAFPDKNKISGAFCMTVSNKISPYILLNHLGSNRDVLTLAHELGHGIHSKFSEKQSILAQEAPLTLAETASTFCEALVFEKMLEQSQDKTEKIELLFHKLSDTYATIMRQNFFVMFELDAHKQIPQGVRITDLHKLYLDNLQKQFGDSVEVDEVFKYEWLHIPHIVNSPFYCYAYSFGELLSLALYNNYKKRGSRYIKTIKDILSAGGSRNAEDLLKEQGIDITKQSFWQSSFDYISSIIDELEGLLD